MTQSAAIEIQQALHGYHGGHRLLACSSKLSPIDARAMLVLSDASASSLPSAFQEYLTGYPLPSGDTYALARTWYAPEMARPGCVWTHTLLIPNKQLSAICSAGALVSLHARPQDPEDRLYSSPIHLSDSPLLEQRHNGVPMWDRDVAEAALEALYTRANHGVVLGAHSSNEFEPLLLAIWTQQWAELRATFSFCTGAAALRMIGDSLLDLQVVPYRLASQLQRSARNMVVIDSPESVIGRDADRETAVTLAAADLSSESGLKFRKVLARLGRLAGASRAYFIPLIEIFKSTDIPQSGLSKASEVIEILTHRFEGASVTDRLKVALIGPIGTRDPEICKLDESSILRAMASVRFPPSLRISEMQWESRVARLVGSSPREALLMCQELAGKVSDPFVEGLLAQAFEALADTDVLEEWPPEVTSELVAIVPHLVGLSAVWQGSAWHQREIYSRVREELDRRPELRRIAVAAMLSARSDAAVDMLMGEDPESLIPAVLDWVNAAESEGPQIPYGWIRAIEGRDECLLGWVKSRKRVHHHAAWLVLTTISPFSESILAHQGDISRLVSSYDWSIVEKSDRIRMAAICTAIGLCHDVDVSRILLEFGFATTHDAFATEAVPIKECQLLEQLLPNLGWCRNWDRCERLRRALVKVVIKRNWSPHFLKDCCPSPGLLEQTLRSGRGIPGFKKLRKQLDK